MSIFSKNLFYEEINNYGWLKHLRLIKKIDKKSQTFFKCYCHILRNTGDFFQGFTDI